MKQRMVEALKGWEAGVADVNAKGGINGRPLELVVRDQKSSATEAVAVVPPSSTRHCQSSLGELASPAPAH